MPINVQVKKWHLAYFVPIDGHFGQMLWDIDFKFVLPPIYINFDVQTNFKVNQTQIVHAVPNKSLKWSYLKTPFCLPPPPPPLKFILEYRKKGYVACVKYNNETCSGFDTALDIGN